MNIPYYNQPSLLVSQPFGDFYVVSILASQLVEVSHSLAAKYMDGQLDGVQRAINKERIKNISKYCLTDSPLFPNTIILAANIDEDGDVLEEESKWRILDNNLIIPFPIKSASIVDGQHRIEGIKRALSEGAQDFNLVCAVYLDLPIANQAEVFATINFNQQKVDKSLAYQLFGYDMDSTEPKYWAPDTLSVNLARILGRQKSSPFRNHIGYGIKDTELHVDKNEDFEEVKKEFENDPWKVSTSTMVGGITKLISKNATNDRYELHKKRIIKKDRSVLSSGRLPLPPLRNLYLNFEDQTIYQIIECYFLSAKENLWLDKNTVLKKTIGIQALFDLLNYILSNLNNLPFQKINKGYFDEILAKVDIPSVENIGKNYSGSGRTAIKNELVSQVSLLMQDQTSST